MRPTSRAAPNRAGPAQNPLRRTGGTRGAASGSLRCPKTTVRGRGQPAAGSARRHDSLRRQQPQGDGVRYRAMPTANAWRCLPADRRDSPHVSSILQRADFLLDSDAILAYGRLIPGISGLTTVCLSRILLATNASNDPLRTYAAGALPIAPPLLRIVTSRVGNGIQSPNPSCLSNPARASACTKSRD